MRMVGVSAAIGVGCFLIVALGGQYLQRSVPEWIPQLLWVVLVAGGSAFCGYRNPDRAWRWGAIIVGVQPLAALVLIPALESLSNSPQSSIGGIAAVALFAVVAIIFSPLAMLWSRWGSRLATRRAANSVV